MQLPEAVQARLDRLAPDQREAATSPPGPVLCVAPAGSGKTTTVVARIAWRIAMGADPAGICAPTFNKLAADELRERLDAALEPLGHPAGSVRVRTFHALGREILRDAGVDVERLVDRASVLADLAGGPPRPVSPEGTGFADNVPLPIAHHHRPGGVYAIPRHGPLQQ